MSEQDDGEELGIWTEVARLIEVTLDEASIGRNNAEVEHEREVAIFDLLEKNRFALEAHEAGPYTLRLSLVDNRLVFTVGDEAPSLADRLAPEHLEIATGDPDALAGRIHDAGAIFIGRYTPEVIGDYVAGSNHVPPTARSARFTSGLGVLDFMKRTSTLKLDPDSLAALGPAAMALAEAEGLDAHRRSVAIRLNRRD